MPPTAFFGAGSAPERSNPDGCGRAAAIGISGSQVLGTEAPADPLAATQEELPGGCYPPLPTGTPPHLAYSCHTQGAPPEEQKSPAQQKTPRRCIAHRGAPPLCSDQDPGGVSRAPPWAARRGAKYAVLQNYVCTIGQHCPLQKGVMLPNFLLACRGHVPAQPQHCPLQRG